MNTDIEPISVTDKSRLKKFITNLRSGKYKKTTLVLRKNKNCFCVTGLAIETFRQNNKKVEDWSYNSEEKEWYWNDNQYELYRDSDVADWFVDWNFSITWGQIDLALGTKRARNLYGQKNGWSRASFDDSMDAGLDIMELNDNTNITFKEFANIFEVCATKTSIQRKLKESK